MEGKKEGLETSILYHSRGERKEKSILGDFCFSVIQHQEVLGRSPGLRHLVHSRQARSLWHEVSHSKVSFAEGWREGRKPVKRKRRPPASQST